MNVVVCDKVVTGNKIYIISTVYINTYAASVIDGAVLYSTYNCATSMLSAAVGRLLFKEKLTNKQMIGVIVGIVSIMLLCI